MWGTYRPGLYFGMRMRNPKSPLLGLMWVDPAREDPLNNIRHEAQQRDGLQQYGWAQHDGESFGVQHLHDGLYNITTSWAKNWSPGSPGCGDLGVSVSASTWAANHAAQGAASGKDGGDDDYGVDEYDSADVISYNELVLNRGAQRDKRPEKRPPPPKPGHTISLFLYVANEDGSALEFSPSAARQALSQQAQHAQQAVVRGSAERLGSWALHMSSGVKAGGPHSDTAAGPSINYVAMKTPHFHNLTALVRQVLYRSLYDQHISGSRAYRLVLPDRMQPGANLAVLQITAQLPLHVDLSLLAGAVTGHKLAAGGQEGWLSRLSSVRGEQLQRLLARRSDEFASRFDETFGRMDSQQLPAGTQQVSQAALSNMLGGMGYWYGHSLVRVPPPAVGPGGAANPGDRGEVRPLWDAPLFSAVPSRSFFPRGFMWDEGFHQLLIRRWSPSLSREVLAHWMDLMTGPGWIAREQILGMEARSRVPDEFVVQSPTAANPPTFFLLLASMSERVAAAAAAQSWDDVAAADAQFLREAWPRINAWYLWFNTTQAGPVPGSYRWRGREADSARELNPKTLTSGLDDYPRASHPSAEERHVDLRCWMALASRSLATIGSNLGMPQEEVAPIEATAAMLEDFDSLNALHLDQSTWQYLDWGNHTQDVELRRVVVQQAGKPMTRELQRVVHQAPTLQFVPHYGYVSLFPLLMKLIPSDSSILGKQLDLLRDPDHLWTDYGLRSLSKLSTMYGKYNTEHDAPYWRGPIWININFLTVKALKHYADVPGPYQQQAADLHKQLRWKTLSNLVQQYKATGYLWEQYDDESGSGKGCHPFTGWSALLVLMAAEL